MHYSLSIEIPTNGQIAVLQSRGSTFNIYIGIQNIVILYSKKRSTLVFTETGSTIPTGLNTALCNKDQAIYSPVASKI